MKFINRALSDKKQLLRFAGVFLVTLFSFLYAVYYAETYNKFGTSYSPDEANYINMARRLLEEGYYSYWGNAPDAYVSPGYPLFLTVCMAVFGTDLEAIFCIKIVQAVLSALTVFLTFLLGYLLTNKYSAGLIASVLIALNGSYSMYSRYLLTETFYYFTMLLALVVFFVSMKKNKLWLYVLAGVCFCVCVMVRPLIIVALPFMYIPLLIKHWREWKKILLPIALFAAGFIAAALPWWIRNIVTLDKLVLFATQTNPLYAGLAPDVQALGLENPKTLLGNLKLLLQLLRENFKDTVYWLTFGKFNIIFMGESFAAYGVQLTTIVKNFTLYVGLTGAVSALFVKRLRWEAVAFWVYFASIFLFVPTARYGLQYLPFLAIFAGALISAASSHIHCGKTEKADDA